MKVLETERLVMRPLTGDDFPDYAAMLADPEVTDGLGMTGGSSPTEAWANLAIFIGHQQMRGFSNWALIHKATGRFVGRAGPWQPYGFPGLSVGWCLHRDFWGQGYATEAARAALHYCFTELAADEVISLILPDNPRSAAVAERIGHSYRGEIEHRGRRQLLYAQRAPQRP